MQPNQERFEKALPPDWDRIKGIWDGCEAFLRGHDIHPDVTYAICMSAQELLENAVKYGAFSRPESSIHCSIEVAPRDITVEVKCPTSYDSQSLRKFDETIQWIRGFQNPFEAYVERMKQISARPYEPGQSGLGLARIAYEGQCILDFYVNDQDVLSVSAVYQR